MLREERREKGRGERRGEVRGERRRGGKRAEREGERGEETERKTERRQRERQRGDREETERRQRERQRGDREEAERKAERRQRERHAGNCNCLRAFDAIVWHEFQHVYLSLSTFDAIVSEHTGGALAPIMHATTRTNHSVLTPMQTISYRLATSIRNWFKAPSASFSICFALCMLADTW